MQLAHRREMSLLCIWPLFFAYAGASSGDVEYPASEITVFGPSGGSVLLQLQESEQALCPLNCQLEVRKNATYLVTKSRIPTNKTRTQCTAIGHKCHVLPGGRLELTEVTPEVSGNYSMILWSSGRCTLKKSFRVHIQDPVSEPDVEFNCFADGVIELCCRVENGTEVSYNWILKATYYNHSTSCMNITERQIELTNVTCTAWNLVSQRTSRAMNVTCIETTTPTPTPTPTPTSLSTDFSSAWSTATNSTGNSTARSNGCRTWKGFTCVQWSAIGAASILIVTVLPLIVGVLCTMPPKAD